MKNRMFGIVLTGHGGPEKLVWSDDLAKPAPGPGEVLIRVTAAGVNNTDVNTRLAWYSKGDRNAEDAAWSGEPIRFPRIQGADVCGTIVEIGAGVATDRLGERVLVEPCLQEARGRQLSTPWYLGSECDGGFAEFMTVAARHAYKIKCGWSDVELASIPCSYSTAENMLTRANVRAGDVVLVTGASGGVGSAAVQLAQARKANVIAITGAGKADRLRELGATKTFSRDQDLTEALGANSVDVVIDLVGGSAWPGLLDVLRPFGRYAVSGAIAGPIVELDLRTLYLKDQSFFGCTVLEHEVFSNLVHRIERDEIIPLVAGTFALRDIVRAQEEFLEKRHIGKLVLTVSE